jgi:hypothetical protein
VVVIKNQSLTAPQFKHAEDAENQLEFSMLPRHVPQRCDPWSQTLRVSSERKKPELLNTEEHEKRFPLLHARMTRYESLKSKYDQIDPRARLDKLAFLYKQINNTSKSQSMSKPAPFVEHQEAQKRSSTFFQKYMNPTVLN